MVRFIHTGDWQLGMNYKHVGEKGSQLRQARLDALSHLVKLADETSADFIVATGDQFEHNQVEPALVQQVVSILAKSKVPIYLIPGNHDPYNRQSVYKHHAWTQAEKVRILTERSPLEVLPNVELYPCPLFEDHGTEDPTSWIPRRENTNTIRIGVAHGSLMIRDDIDFTDSYPISSQAVQEHDLDYLAIGHWHSRLVSGQDKRTAYAGTHETTKFGENASGYALLVDIDAPKAELILNPVRTGLYDWKQFTKHIRTEADLLALEHELISLSNPETTLVDVILDGQISPTLENRVSVDIRTLVTTRFLYGRLTSNLKMTLSQEEIEQMSLSGVTKVVMEKLLSEHTSESRQAISCLASKLSSKDVIA